MRLFVSVAAALVLATATAAAVSGPPSPTLVGHTVLLKKVTKTSGCTLAADPDRRCSPGAYYSKLTKSVICSPTFHTDDVRYVPASEKRDVQAAYGLGSKSY